MKIRELNMDGLVGPTHSYAGLAEGNLASSRNAFCQSNPQSAALQGLAKMKLLHGLGLKQGVFPPHFRPNLDLLFQLGFKGSASEQIKKAYQTAPNILSASYSAASMWAANMATVTSSKDTKDHKTHFTAANLISNLHRCQEAQFSKFLLEKIFSNEDFFVHHPVLPSCFLTSDEGAANHTRFCATHSHPGVHLFVYGKKSTSRELQSARRKYPARQAFEASLAVSRNHQLLDSNTIFAQQNPSAIDAGVFHNDVISVGNENLFLVHEHAFVNQTSVLDELQEKLSFPLHLIEIKNSEISVNEAVDSYLFNSQVITLPEQDAMALIAPLECELNNHVKQCIDEIILSSNNPLKCVYYLDLKQSMRNGGGPACLRLRVPLNTQELKEMHQGVLLDTALINRLEQWVIKHYRYELFAYDLLDPDFITEIMEALDELTQILDLGSIYPFQQG